MKVRKLGPTHNELHATVANLLDWVLLPPAFYTTFPAGWGQLSGPMANQLKRCGLKAGVPDILLFPGNGRCFGIELKVGKDTLSKEQRETFNKLEHAGVQIYICRRVEQVMTALILKQVPMRRITGGEEWQPSRNEPQPVEIYAAPVDIGAAEGESDGAR